MSQWTIKTFHKNKAVLIRIATDDHREKTYWGIPVNNQVDIKGIGTFVLNDKDFYLNSKRIPVYYFNTEHLSPINMKTTQVSQMTPIDLLTMKDANIAQQIFSASQNKMNIGMIGIMLSILSLIGIGAVYYLLQQDIAKILEILKLVGGVS